MAADEDDAGTSPGPSIVDEPAPPRYPQHWEADVVLRDGGTAHVRPIVPEDAAALQAFHVRQSERSTYFRFFAPLERLPERDLARFTQLDHVDRVALVAVTTEADQERIVAVGRFDRVGSRTAEVAFNVADDHHGRGLGSVLLEHLAAAARERGIVRFTADVLPQNSQMLGVFREAGYVVEQHLDDGIVTVSFHIDPTERSLAVMADREHRAEARSVHALLTPESVLVVAEGAETALAEAVVGHLVTTAQDEHPDAGARDVADPGAPVRAPELHVVGLGEVPTPVHRWAGVDELPGPVDLVVLAVPADRAAAVVRQCSRLSPRAVVVLSGGFAETGPVGVEHQRDLVRTAHAHGMRVLGPASFGFLRHGSAGHPTVNASLSEEMPVPGRLALFCQSASLAVRLISSSRRRGLGLSTFVSAGNRADVSGNDVMQFCTEDDRTEVVALYLESIGNPRKFARVARRLAGTKPLVVFTAGRSGHVNPAGHVVRRTRTPRRALDELLRQSGVIRVESTHQLLDVSQLLAHQPVPTGKRVAVLASSESLAALVTEAVTAAGMTVRHRRITLSVAGYGELDPDQLAADLDAVYSDEGTDVVMVVHVPTLGEPDGRVATAVARAAAGSGRTTLACIRGLNGLTPDLTATDAEGRAWTVPAYLVPEDGVAALASAVQYGVWRATDRGRPLAFEGVDRAAARRLVEGELAGHGEEVVPLDQARTAELLAAYGMELWPTRVVRDEEEAIRAADELGWPVALKSRLPSLRHRIDLGGVRLDIGGPDGLAKRLAQMRARLEAMGEREPWFEVQPMAPSGAACVVRSSEDPRFGPVVSFGIAGDAVDLLGDLGYAIPPLTDRDVHDLVRAVRASPRLFGYRGLPQLDVDALEQLIGRVAVMSEDLPELHNLELHPVVVGEQGVSVLAARIDLALAGRADGPRRALPA